MQEKFNIEELKKLIIKKYKEKGFNQVEFANHIGTTKQNFNKWLNAPHENMKFLFNILIELDINIGELQECIEEYKISTLKEIVDKIEGGKPKFVVVDECSSISNDTLNILIPKKK